MFGFLFFSARTIRVLSTLCCAAPFLRTKGGAFSENSESRHCPSHGKCWNLLALPAWPALSKNSALVGFFHFRVGPFCARKRALTSPQRKRRGVVRTDFQDLRGAGECVDGVASGFAKLRRDENAATPAPGGR